MTMKQQKYFLERIFEQGVDGNNANAYYPITEYLKMCPTEVEKMDFNFSALLSVLSKLSKKWDKEIDKII